MKEGPIIPVQVFVTLYPHVEMPLRKMSGIFDCIKISDQNPREPGKS
jgi:hypothetical protein